MKSWGRIWILLGLVAAAPAWGLDPAKRFDEYGQERWDVDDGLPQSSVNSIIQSEDHYLWMATFYGVVRFDGARFQNYDAATIPGLDSNRILALAERAGTLFLGTEGHGLRAWEGPGSGGAQPLLSGTSVPWIDVDVEGRVWASADGVLFEIVGRPHGWEARKVSGGGMAPRMLDHAGRVWLATAEGVRRAGDRDGEKDFSSGLPSGGITCLYEDSSRSVWVGTSAGVARIFPDDRVHFYDELGGVVVSSILEDDDGNVWIATRQGVLRYREGVFDRFGPEEGLVADVVQDIHLDSEGGLWIGTDGGGLQRLRDLPFQVLGRPEGLSHDVALSLLEDSRGTIWVGTNCGGLNEIRGQGPRPAKLPGVPACTWALSEGSDGSLWVGSWGGGLRRVLDGEVTHYRVEDGLPGNIVVALHQGRNDVLWIGTNGGGLGRFDGREFQTFTTEDGLPDDDVRVVHEAEDGRVWVGTASGLVVLKNGLFGRPFHPRVNESVRAIHEDESGVIWVGTYGGGLKRIEGGSVSSFGKKQGLQDNVVSAILDDGFGNFWMTGNRGISRVSKLDLENQARGVLPLVRSTPYGTADGLRSPECNGGFQPAACRSSTGKLYFPTVQGVAVVDPAVILDEIHTPPVIIESVTVDGQDVPIRDGIELPPGSDSLEVRYTAISLGAPDKLRFRYRLDGVDTRWRSAGSRREALYVNLEPGEFTFRVLASSQGGRWHRSGATWSFRVLPAFYETRWFWGVVIAGSLFMAGGVYGVRVRTLKSRERRLMHLVDERTFNLQQEKGRAEEARLSGRGGAGRGGAPTEGRPGDHGGAEAAGVRAAHRQAGCRGCQPGQEPVPRQHEPRAAHAAQRHHRVQRHADGGHRRRRTGSRGSGEHQSLGQAAALPGGRRPRAVPAGGRGRDSQPAGGRRPPIF